MKTKLCLCILWSVCSLNIAYSTTGIYESPLVSRPAGRKNILQLGTSKSTGVSANLSSTAKRTSALKLPGDRVPFSPKLIHGPQPAPASQFYSPPPQIQGRMRPNSPEPKIRHDFAYLPDVSVTCSTADLVVRVKKAFYGFAANAGELTLGNTCKSNGVLRPYGDLLFTYPLTECDGKRETPPGYIIYTFVLHYAPQLNRIPRMTHRVNVEIQCRFQRYHHVYQLAVRPTWKTPTLRKRLKGRTDDFRVQLMDDAWTMPAKSPMYQLGQTVHFQVSAFHLLPGGKLFINYCYATTSNDTNTAHKYNIIDNFGCMLESQRNPGASQFISPRTDDTLRFSLNAFQFTSDPNTQVFIHCKLSVTTEDPSPLHKSCTFREKRWQALMGKDIICDCCDSKCVTSKPRRAMLEGFASSGPLMISDQRATPQESSPSVSSLPATVSDEDGDIIWFEAKMDELHTPEDQLEDFDVETYHDERQSYTHSMEEERATDREGEEHEVEESVSRMGKVFEGTQRSSVRYSELIGEEGSVEKIGSEFWPEGQWEREGSVLMEEGGSSEGEWVGPGMEEESGSQDREVTLAMKGWGFGVGEELSRETPNKEAEEEEEETVERGEEEHMFPIFKTEGEKILSDYNGLEETGMVGEGDTLWTFKWR